VILANAWLLGEQGAEATSPFSLFTSLSSGSPRKRGLALFPVASAERDFTVVRP